MYCPNCGSENSQDQRFCRVCGLHLQTISQVVVHQIKAGQRAGTPPASQDQWRSLRQNPLCYGFFLLILGLIIIALGKKVLGEQLVADVGTVLALVGVAFFVIKGLFLFSRSRGAQSNEDLSRAGTTTELTPLLEAKEQPSVTEFTTRNFDRIYVERDDHKTPE
jgi:low temperature requirement protein LtrA